MQERHGAHCARLMREIGVQRSAEVCGHRVKKRQVSFGHGLVSRQLGLVYPCPFLWGLAVRKRRPRFKRLARCGFAAVALAQNARHGRIDRHHRGVVQGVAVNFARVLPDRNERVGGRPDNASGGGMVCIGTPLADKCHPLARSVNFNRGQRDRGKRRPGSEQAVLGVEVNRPKPARPVARLTNMHGWVRRELLDHCTCRER
mmetsp:Transcript_3689/g.9138  ORF Transcript_3689/g.9138 Transcript_3689/m.9138 type:complete len:202 (+) Transcript_3689:186-791(+)